jgi:hypothetical protein
MYYLYLKALLDNETDALLIFYGRFVFRYNKINQSEKNN